MQQQQSHVLHGLRGGVCVLRSGRLCSVLELRVKEWAEGREEGWVGEKEEEIGTNATPTPMDNAIATIVNTTMKMTGPAFISKCCWEKKGRRVGLVLGPGWFTACTACTACCVGVEVTVAITVMAEGVTVTISVVWELRLRGRA